MDRRSAGRRASDRRCEELAASVEALQTELANAQACLNNALIARDDALADTARHRAILEAYGHYRPAPL